MKYKNKTYEGEIPTKEIRKFLNNKWIGENKLILSKSSREILDYIEKENDFMGNTIEVLINYLDWDSAKTMFKAEYVEKVDSGKEKWSQITDINEAVADMLDYYSFGLMKALDERGISASRTILKLKAWSWLLGRNDLVEILDDDDNYNPYGMPALIKWAEELGLPVTDNCKEFAKHKASY